MSNEPGLSLGRLVAAERNAAAALNLTKELSRRLTVAEARLLKAETQAQQDAQTIAALNGRTAALIGSGSTSGQ